MEQQVLSKEQEMFGLIAEHESSEMTVKDFCELYDMAQGTYYYWQKKYHASLEEKQPVPQSGFTLLEVEQQQEENLEGLLLEYRGLKFYREPSIAFIKALMS